jgi:NitT/TauT family transport system substrate-binding protein
MVNHGARSTLRRGYRWAWLLLAISLPTPEALAASDTDSPELAQVHLGIARSMSDSGYYVADKKGYFRAEGLAITMTAFSSAALMVAPLGTGELDVGGGTVSAGLYNAVSRGIDLKVVADQASMRPGYGFAGLMVRKDLVESGRYRTLADLKGLRIAMTAPGTGTSSTLNQLMIKGGLTYQDADIVYLAFPEHLTAYRNKAIDASLTTEPTMTQMIDEGLAVRAMGNDQVVPDQQIAVAIYSGKFVAERRDVAQRFMRAYLRGVRDYFRALKGGRLAGPNADEIIAILTEYTTIKDPAVYRRIIPSSVDPDGRVKLDSLKTDLAFYKEHGFVQSPTIEVEDVVDNSFVEDAVKALGPYDGPRDP